MDILGFIVILAALFAAPRLGLDEAALQLMQRARERGVLTYNQVRNWYLVKAVRPTQWLLVASAVIQIIVMAVAVYAAAGRIHELRGGDGEAIVLADELTISLYWLIGIVVGSLVLHAVSVWWQWSSLPRYRREQVHTDPDDPESPLVWVDALDANGSPQVDDERPDYRPGRFSFKRSLALALLTYAALAALLMWNGVRSESTPLFTVGAICLYLVIIVIGVFASFIAWLLEKGSSLLEFIATVVSKEVLVALPGFKWSNIEQHLSGVNILEQERHAAALRSFAPSLALHITPFVAFVWMWTSPLVAKFALTFLFITTITGYYLAKNGGAQEVEQRRYRFARVMFYALPGLCLAAFLYGLLPAEVHAAVAGQLANVKSAVVGYGSGQETIGVNAWWQNLLAIVICGGVTLGLSAIAFFFEPIGQPSGWFQRGLKGAAVIGLACTLWFVFCLVKNIMGKQTVGLPTVPALSKTAPADQIAAPKATAATTSSSPKDKDAAKPSKAPATAKKARPSSEGRDKPPSRYAGVPGSPAPNSPRWQLDPEFVTEYRAVTGENP